MIRRKRSLPRSSQSCAQQQQQRKGRIRNSRYYPALAILLVMAFHVQLAVAAVAAATSTSTSTTNSPAITIPVAAMQRKGFAISKPKSSLCFRLRGGGTEPPFEVQQSTNTTANNINNNGGESSSSSSSSSSSLSPYLHSYSLPQTITVRITTLDLPAILTSAGSLLCKAADTVLPRLQQQWERQWELKWQRQWQPPPAVGAELGRSSGGGSGGGSRGGGGSGSGSGSRGGSRDPPKKEPEESSYAASSRSESAGAFGTSSFRPYGGTSTTTSSATTTNHLLATAPAAILRRTLVVLLLVEALDRAGILCVFRDKASRMAGGLRAAWCHRVIPALKKPLRIGDCGRRWWTMAEATIVKAFRDLNGKEKGNGSGSGNDNGKELVEAVAQWLRNTGTHRIQKLWTPRSAFAVGVAAGTVVFPLLPPKRLVWLVLMQLQLQLLQPGLWLDRNRTPGVAPQVRLIKRLPKRWRAWLAVRMRLPPGSFEGEDTGTDRHQHQQPRQRDYHLGYGGGRAIAERHHTTAAVATSATTAAPHKRRTVARDGGYSLGIASFRQQQQQQQQQQRQQQQQQQQDDNESDHGDCQRGEATSTNTYQTGHNTRLEALRHGFWGGCCCAVLRSVVAGSRYT